MAKYEGPDRTLHGCMIEARCCPSGCINPFDGSQCDMDFCPDCGTEMRTIFVMDLPCNKCIDGVSSYGKSDALQSAAVEDKRRIVEAAKVFDKIKWNICDSPESSIWSDVSKIEELLTEGAS